MTMLSNETVRKLQEMHLGVMAEAFSTQLQDSQFQTVSFEDRFAMLVDAEWSARKSNRLTRLIRNAGYADPAPGLLHLPPGSTQCHRSGSHWGRKDLSGLRPWHGCQPQFLFRAVYSPARSAGGDLCGPGQRNLPGLYEKAQERETAHPG